MMKSQKKNELLPRSDLGRNEVKFAFFGTPELATVVLDALENVGYLPTLVVTTPDQKKGRGMNLTQSPVKQWANKRNVEIIAPEVLDDITAEIIRAKNCYLFIVIYYGKVLPKEILEIPAHGTLNIHFSLLPRWRGTSPVRSAILNDDHEVGTSIILLDEKIDHGPVIAQKKIVVPEWPPRARELEALATRESARLLIEILPSWVAGDIEAHEQNHDVATYCTNIAKEDGLLNLSDDAYKNLLKIRAFDTTVGTHAFFERGGKKIRVGILDAHIDPSTKLGARKLIIDKVKPEGKKEMAYEEFLRSGAKPI
ncbi:MAG: methionyl-tRNA formyltransferase [Candidatus Kaiserbacteria bacterium]|nr:methionyl-tRNA formyltransferase [Candidatus Kaiserbacteria bacterium]